MKAIAQAVGIQAPSLYNHFASKQELFDAIIRDLTEKCRGRRRALA